MLNAYDVIVHVVQASPAIESITLVTYLDGPNWGDQPHTREEPDLKSLLEGLRKDRGPRLFTEVLRGDVSAQSLCNFAKRLNDNSLLGICSRVRLIDGGFAHIPMIDFMCGVSMTNLETLTHLLKDVAEGQGCLLETGRSYHYYGFQLFDEVRWRIFLGKCLLMSGFTDDRYVGHQLVDGYCVLRLSSGKSKNLIPKVVAG